MVAKIQLWVSGGMANAVFGRWLGNRIFGACYFESSTYGALILYKYANDLDSATGNKE